jgi:hypothetical protein
MNAQSAGGGLDFVAQMRLGQNRVVITSTVLADEGKAEGGYCTARYQLKR